MMQIHFHLLNSPTNFISRDDDLSTCKYAYWSHLEEAKLIQFLFENKKDINHLAFKDQVFGKATTAIAHLCERGPVKNMKMCKLKWKSMHISFICVFTCILIYVTS